MTETGDTRAARAEILRYLRLAEMNLQGLLLPRMGEPPADKDKLEFAIVALGCVIDYVEGNDESC